MPDTNMTLRSYGMQLCFATFGPTDWDPSQTVRTLHAFLVSRGLLLPPRPAFA